MIISTTDGLYTYTRAESSSTGAVIVVHSITSNARVASTQGYQIKKQVGRNRIETDVEFIDIESNVRTNLLPQLEHPSSVNVTFDSNVALRGTDALTMTIVGYTIDDQLQDMDDGTLLIKLKLIEVIGV